MTKVLYFASCRDCTKLSEEDLPLEGLCVTDAVERLVERHPMLSRVIPQCRVALNQEFVTGEEIVGDHAELALIPPVAGGNNTHTLSRIRETPLRIDDVLDRVSHPTAGAEVIMIGTVRNHSEGESVESLKYEAYAAMAEKVMDSIVHDVQTEVPGCMAAVDHRVGHLEIGDRAVVVAASAPHRKEAFQACQMIIDRLKETTPIWKYEMRESGSVWVGLGP